MKVRIKTSPGSNGATIEPTDADGVAMNEQINGCYAYDVRQQVGEHARATLFVFAEMDVTAEADLVQVPRSLIGRARDLAARLGNPAVTAAFGELLGASMKQGE